MFLGYGFTSGLMMQVSELSYRGIFKPIAGNDQTCKLFIISWIHLIPTLALCYGLLSKKPERSFCVYDNSLNSSEEMCLKLIACVKGRCQNNMYDFCRHSFYLAMIMTSAQ
jgi:hypothetical protein